MSEAKVHTLFCLLLIIAGLLAYMHRFILDDAFIAFRYAENFVEGHGLVWNPGERVQGYTNFLWVLWISFGLYLGFSPVTFSIYSGLFIFIASLVLFYNLSHLVFASRRYALVGVALLFINYSFFSFATSGLETQLQVFLFVAIAYLICYTYAKSKLSPAIILILALVSVLALLTRPDSIIAVFVASCFVVYLFRSKPKLILLYISILLLCGGAFLLWKYSYYGDILPNTFYAKTSNASPVRGMMYIIYFFYTYWLFPLLFMLLFFIPKLFQERLPRFIFIYAASCTVLWFAYITKVGGGFMEFRLLMPVYPFLILILAGIVYSSRKKAIKIAVVLIVLFGSISHYYTFQGRNNIESIDGLHSHLVAADQNWIQVGKAFKRLFHDDKQDVIIATTASGAIPYYSELQCVDMLGLTDRWVAKNGLVINDIPGHQRLAPFDYLLRKGVNICIFNPIVVQRNKKFPYETDLLQKYFDTSKHDVQVVEININKTYKVMVFYLKKSKFIEKIINKHNLTRYPVKDLFKADA